MKSPGVGMVYCNGFTFPDSPTPPDKKYADDLGRIFPLYDALEDPEFVCPMGLFWPSVLALEPFPAMGL